MDQARGCIPSDINPIIDYLQEKRGFDFSGYHVPMLERRIGQRLAAKKCATHQDYLSCLKSDDNELDRLIDALTINVSRFFRNTLTFEYIADKILPAMVQEKARLKGDSLRIWSAGCANGEEPYSLAILIRECLRKEELTMDVHIFATDINDNVLRKAREAEYSSESVGNIKNRLLMTYFTQAGESFALRQDIQDAVTFTRYDLLDKRHSVPPESIFGNFDMILCRNVLIYFIIPYQERIFARLYQSLAAKGHLVLGEAEIPSAKYRDLFDAVTDCGHIYRKR